MEVVPPSSSYLTAQLDGIDHLARQLSNRDVTSEGDQRCVQACVADNLGATLQLDGAGTPGDAGPDIVEVVVHGIRMALRPDEVPDNVEFTDVDSGVIHDLRHAEHVGVAAAHAADDLASLLVADPFAALTQLHERLTNGLVANDRTGQPRTIELTVNDTSTGRIVYFATPPDKLEGEITALTDWIAGVGGRLHPVTIAGIIHLELLRIHPFDAANGRLARAASRLYLRHAGYDPHRIALTDVVFAENPMGYYTEVASTSRRRDPTSWLERWADTLSIGLLRAQLRLHPRALPTDPFIAQIVRQAASMDDPHTGAFTLGDFLAATCLDRDEASHRLADLVRSGAIEPIPGTRSLRYRLQAAMTDPGN
ncbi:MAG: Fic family protein [Nitriliruptoraceae bacterium]